MSLKRYIIYINVVLSLLSATFFYGCSSAMKGDVVIENAEKRPTVVTKNHTVIYSQNGVLSYRFETPLMERYELVNQPYMEFREGVSVETYNDSTAQVASTIVADYATFDEKLELWEAKGNVRGANVDGDKIFTEQLFWDVKKDKIYSEVDTKIVRGEEVTIGSSFTSDGQFKNIEYTQTRGILLFDTTKSVAQDTLLVDSL